MAVYNVEVDFTNRERDTNGRFVTYPSFVTLVAATDAEAVIIAAQLVAALRDTRDVFTGQVIDGMVTATRITSVIE